MQKAWQRARISSWPNSYEQSMQEPTRARIVHLVARTQARRAAERLPLPYAAAALRAMAQRTTESKA